MDDADTLTIRPNYSGLLIAIVLLGVAVGVETTVLSILIRDDDFASSLFGWVLLIYLIVFLFLLVLGLLHVLWGHLAVLLSGLRPSMTVRINRQGIYYPRRHDGLINWNLVRDVQVHRGYNGSSLWFMIDPSLPLRGYSMLDHVSNIGRKERVGFVRLMSHQYSFSAPELFQELRRLAPEHVHMSFPLN